MRVFIATFFHLNLSWPRRITRQDGHRQALGLWMEIAENKLGKVKLSKEDTDHANRIVITDTGTPGSRNVARGKKETDFN